MLTITFQTLRSRIGTLAGAFVAIFLAVTSCFAMGLLLAGGLSSPGPGRFVAADAVVVGDATVTEGQGDRAFNAEAAVAPSLPERWVSEVAATEGVQSATKDVTFRLTVTAPQATTVPDAGIAGHNWEAAELTPYRLKSGSEPVDSDQVVVDSRLGLEVGQTVEAATPVGVRQFEVSGVADTDRLVDGAKASAFFSDEAAQTLSDRPGRVNAVGITLDSGANLSEVSGALHERLGPTVEVLDQAHAANADAADPHADQRIGMVAIFGAAGGIAASIALFVIAGAFALSIAQRRAETASLRALGASPRQVRRLIAGEALIVSLVAGALGILAGRPLADAVAGWVIERGDAPSDFVLGASLIPLIAALGLGVLVTQVAIIAAARRAGRIRPAEALREAAIEHARPGWIRAFGGVSLICGGVALAVATSGELAMAMAVLSGLLLAMGVGCLGQWLLGAPASLLSRPLRGLGASGLLASTSLAASRWRSAALATPIMLIVVLAGTQGMLSHSDRANTQAVTADWLQTDYVVTGAEGAPVPPETASEVAALPDVVDVVGTPSTEVFLLDRGLDNDDQSWSARGIDGASDLIDPGVTAGALADIEGDSVAISDVIAQEGGFEPGDELQARMADTTPTTLRIAAVFTRNDGLGDVLLDSERAREHSTLAGSESVLVRGNSAERSLTRYVAEHPSLEVSARSDYLSALETEGQEEAWGVWLIISLVAVFCALALLNTAAVATTERRQEFRSIGLLGGTRSQTLGAISLEMLTIVFVGLAAGAVLVFVSTLNVSSGVTGFPLEAPSSLMAGLGIGAIVLCAVATTITVRLGLGRKPVRTE